MKNRKFPKQCPSCEGELVVTQLRCDACETEVSGQYPLPQLAALSTDDQSFILQFVAASGSLKQMAKQLGVSYPTVRNRLNEVIEILTDSNETKQTESTQTDGTSEPT